MTGSVEGNQILLARYDYLSNFASSVDAEVEGDIIKGKEYFPAMDVPASDSYPAFHINARREKFSLVRTNPKIVRQDTPRD